MDYSSGCTYCGGSFNLVREHVIPAHWWGTRTYESTSAWLVPACGDCNSLAGAHVCFSVPDKAAFILKRYRSKFARYLKIPYWSPEELNKMGYKIRIRIEEGIIARNLLLRRIEHLKCVSEYSADYMRPKWIEDEMHKIETSYKKTLASLKRKRKQKTTV